MIEPLRSVQTAPQLIASIPIKVARAEIRKVMGPGLTELKSAIAAQNIAVIGPWFTHHARPPGEIFDFSICLPVATPVSPAGRMLPGEWPALSVVQTIFHGGYEGLGGAWGDFKEQIKAAGYRTADDLWERYLIGPEASADPAAWRTELNKRLEQ